MERELKLRALHEVTGPREGQLDRTALAPAGKSPGMVPVQVGGQDHIDLLGTDAEPPESGQESLGLPLLDLAGALLAELVADARLAHEHAPAVADDQDVAGGRDQVLLVGRLLPLPEDLGDDAEGGAAVVVPATGGEEVELEVSHSHARRQA